MKNSTQSTLAPRVTTVDGVVSFGYTVDSYASLFQMDPGVITGDRKRPNPHSFRIIRSAKGLEYQSNRTVSFGAIRMTTVTGPLMMPGYTSFGPSKTIDYGRCRNRCLEKIFDQLGGNSNLIIDFAERGATIKMLKQTLAFRKYALITLGDIVKKVTRDRKAREKWFTGLSKNSAKARSSRIRNTRHKPKVSRDIRLGPDKGQRFLDEVTGRWLEYRYGWLPLMYSVYDAVDTIYRDIREKVIHVKARSGYSDNTVAKPLGAGTFEDPYRQMTTHDLSVRTEMSILFAIPNDANRLGAWTSLNPLRIAWELLPLSFVADWFVNVGQTLKNLEDWQLRSNQFLKGYQTDSFKEVTRITTWGQTHVPFLYYPNGTPLSGRSSYVFNRTGEHVQLSKERIILNSLPKPGGIRVQFELNTHRMLDAVGLIQQIFVKRYR